MKPTPTSPLERAPLVAFGAHPDDIEFGCGGVKVDDRTWSTRSYDQISVWGHKPPAARG